VIVGDISDIDIGESAIRSRFSDLKGHSKPWTDTRKQYIERLNQFVATEPNERKPGTTPVEFNLYLRDNEIIERRQTWKSLQRELIWTMLGKLSLLNDRFKEEANSYISSFSAFGSSASPSFPSYSIKVTSNSDRA